MEDPNPYLASGAPNSLRDVIKLDRGELAGHACCSPRHIALPLAHEHTTQAGVVDRRLQLADDHTVVGVGPGRPKPVHVLRDPEIDLTTRPDLHRHGPAAGLSADLNLRIVIHDRCGPGVTPG